MPTVTRERSCQHQTRRTIDNENWTLEVEQLSESNKDHVLQLVRNYLDNPDNCSPVLPECLRYVRTTIARALNPSSRQTFRNLPRSLRRGINYYATGAYSALIAGNRVTGGESVRYWIDNLFGTVPLVYCRSPLNSARGNSRLDGSPIAQSTCTDCDSPCPTDEMVTRAGHRVCRNCTTNYRTCIHCEGSFNRDNMTRLSSTRFVCESCYEDRYFTCVRCGNVRTMDEYNEDGYCNDCYEPQAIIQSYSTKNRYPKRGVGPHYLGVELEVELSPRVHDSLESKGESTLGLFSPEFVILKEDGSLNNGFEIVTCPSTLAEHYKLWEKFFSRKPRGLVSFDSQGGHCGLHVHCSRSPLSELSIGKMLAFVNAQSNSEYIRKIAMRDSYYGKTKTDKKVSDARHVNNDRYEALNLQNRHTVEFRIFKGTLKRESFFRALEFCAALVAFCLPARHSINQCVNPRAFFRFVADNKKDYPNLFSFHKVYSNADGVSAFRSDS